MIVMLSGGFDPVHAGHVAMIRAAREYGRVVIALNSDEWLFRKKGYYFQQWAERREILLEMADMVVPVDDSDGTVCDALERIRPNYFANGGDRITANEKEAAVCARIGIHPLFGIGGEKSQSSSALVQRLWQRLHP